MKFKAITQCRVAHPTNAAVPQEVFKPGVEYDTAGHPKWAIERLGNLGYLVPVGTEEQAAAQKLADLEMEERAKKLAEEQLEKERAAAVEAQKEKLAQEEAEKQAEAAAQAVAKAADADKKGKGKG